MMRKSRFRAAFFNLIPPKRHKNVRCIVKRNYYGEKPREYDFERIASTAGVRTHGDFRVKEPRPYSSKCLLGCLPNPLSLRKDRLPMANRTRPIRIEFCVSENEHRIIKSKMAQLGTKNMGAYLRKMAIDGYIIKVDYTQQKKLAAAVSRAASNINQICRRINSKGNLYEDDVTELKERQKEIWQLLKSSQSEEL